MPSIHAHFLPQLVAPEALAGGTVVVIDVLRATSTITYALAAGASASSLAAKSTKHAASPLACRKGGPCWAASAAASRSKVLI